jgi:hypothetical protein
MHAALPAWLCSIALAVVGCAAVVKPQAAPKSPLAPLAVSPDSINLEVFTAPAPVSDPQLDELWKLVDEQSLPADLRTRLAENGLRAGIIGPNVPQALADVLKLTDQPLDSGQLESFNLDPSAVKVRVLHATAGKRVELAVGNPREEITLLESTGGHVRGKTLQKAECRLALRAHLEDDGRVRVELTPELHHGEYKNNIRGSGNDASFLLTQERPKRIFEELTLEPRLAPGQMLLVAARSDRPSSAGEHFFTDASGGAKPVKVLWALRAARASGDRAFADDSEAERPGPVANDQVE